MSVLSDEVLLLAKRAGLHVRGCYDENGSTPAEIERFAALIAAKAGEVMREYCVEYMLSERKALNQHKEIWRTNPHMTPTDDYVADWEDRARSGEFEAEGIRALPGVKLEDLK
jgi:hypothetical protein